MNIRLLLMGVGLVLLGQAGLWAQESDSRKTLPRTEPAPSTPVQNVSNAKADPSPGETGSAAPRKKSKVILRYDSSGRLVLEGESKDVEDLDYVWKNLVAEWEKPQAGAPDIRFYRCKYIDVQLLASMVEEIFTGTSKAARQQAAMQAQRTAQQQQQQLQRQQRQAAGQNAKENTQENTKSKEEDKRSSGLSELESLFGGGGESAKGKATEPIDIRVVPEPQRQILWIVTETPNYPTVIEVIKTLDTSVDAQRDYEIVVLKKLNADDVKTSIEDVLGLGQTTRTANRARPQTNRPAGQATDAQQLAEQLEQELLQIGEKTGSTKDVRISSLPATNSIIVFGPKDIREIVIQMIDKLEEQGAETRVVSIPLENANAETLAATLQKAYGEAAAGPSGKTGNVKITADASINTIFVAAPPVLLEEIQKRIKEAEAQAGEFNPRNIKVLQADATTIAATLDKVYASRRTGKTKISITPDAISNQLVVSAPDDIFNEITKLVALLDQPDAKQAIPKFYKLQYAAAEDVKKQVMEMAVQLIKSDPTSVRSVGAFGVVADATTNNVVIMGSPVMLGIMDRVIPQIDVEPADPTKRITKTIALIKANPQELANNIKQVYGDRKRLGVDPPTATANLAANAVVVEGTLRQIQEIEALIQSIESIVQPNPGEELKQFTIKLAYLDPVQAADMLNNVFQRQFEALKKVGAKGIKESDMTLSIVPDSIGRQLFVNATETNKKKIDEILSEIDRQEAAGPINLRVIQVAQGIDAQEMAKMVEDTIRRGEDIKKQQNTSYKPSYVAIGSDFRTNCLVVAGSPSQFEEVQQLVKDLEGRKPTGPTSIQVINLKNIKSSEVKKVLDQMIEERNQKNQTRKR